MKRSLRRSFARLLFLESLESRRLLTTAMPDSFTLLEDSPTALLDVMANDQLSPGTTAAIISVTSPTVGIVEIRNSNRIAFTPGVNFSGQVSFGYTIRDNLGNESVAVVSVNVQPVNDVPTLDPIANIRTTYNEVGREIILRNVTAGPGEESQDFTIEATSDRPDLIQILDVETQSEGGVAKLKLQTTGGGEGRAIITVRVRDSGGLIVQRSFAVDVIGIQSATPRQNDANMLDVDNDGFVGPLDALNILNRLSTSGDASVPVSSLTQPPPPYFDVNGDNYIDPLDAISIIDALNHRGAGDNDQASAGPRAAKGERILEFKFQIVDQNGMNLDPNPADGISEGLVGLGTEFYVQLLARDLRSVPAGLYASYSNLVYTNVDGSPLSRIEPFSIANDGSIVGSMGTVLGGLKQGVLVDNRGNVAGQRILAGIGEMSNRASFEGDASQFYVVMNTKFTAKEPGVVDLSQQLSDYLLGVPGLVVFDSTGDYLGPAEVLLPSAKVNVLDVINAVDDNFNVFEDSGSTLLDVIANDRLIAGTTASIVNVTTPTSGTIEIRNSNRIAFTPGVNFSGQVSFGYTIRDNLGNESVAVVSVNVQPVNDAPTLDPIANIRTTYNEVGREIILRNVTAGPGEESQDFTIEATSDRPDLIQILDVETQSASGLAKLKLQTTGGGEGQAIVTVRVRDTGGLIVQRSFAVDVIGIQSATPSQNNANMLDVDNDGFVGPLDVLNILNRLSTSGDASVPVSSLTQPPPPYFDVNGDNYIDPLDAISIIDDLNARGSSGSGQGNAGPRAAKGERILEFQFQIVDQNGVSLDPNPADGISEGLVGLGTDFYVRLFARDLRSVPVGLFASYSNLVYTNADGSPASRIEPVDIANDGSIVGSLATVLGGLKQGVLVDNRGNVAGQRILAGIGEMSNRFSYGGTPEFYVVMNTKFSAKEKGVVDLSQQLSDFLMGVPGFVLFNSTGDYLGPAEVLLPTARIFVSDALEAFDDSVTGMEDEVIVIDVLANDVDVTRTVSIVTPLTTPSIGGELSVTNGRIEYLPPANFYGAASFSYTIRTVDGREDSAWVTVTIEPLNDAPTITELPNLSLPEGLTFTSEIFSVSSGPREDQPVRLTAVSNNNTVIPSPILDRVSDGSYRMIFLPPVGASGTTTVMVAVEDGGLDGLLETTEDNLSVLRSFVVTVTQNQRDFGDAPTSSQSGMFASYPTRLNQNGAFHIGTTLRMGDLRDAESDGFPDPLAKGDDNSVADDEDGILFPFTHPINDQVETTSSYVANVSQNGFLDVWIDFNRDGDWDDPGENISRKVAVKAGRNLIPFQIPTLPLTGTVDTTFGRFRLSRTGDLQATGFGGEGEVEDHTMVMNRTFSQELEVYDHILGPHKVNVVDGFLVVTVGDMIVFRAPAENTSVFRRKNMSGETIFEMRNPGSNLPGQLSYEPVSDRIELTLARSDFDLGANTEFLVGLNTIRFGHTSVPSVLSLELEAVRNLNSERTLRIEMSREDSLRTESPWRPAPGRMQDGRWVQVFTVTSSPSSTDPLATLEVVSEAVWRNETRVTDADGDATTSPLDVLALVNFINAKTFGEEGLLPPRTDSSIAKFPDVDGDQFLSALDVLNVINFLNTRGNGAGGNGEGEGEGVLFSQSMKASFTVSPEAVDRYMYAYTDDFDQENRNNRRRRSL